jgi:hypothetical protein
MKAGGTVRLVAVDDADFDDDDDIEDCDDDNEFCLGYCLVRGTAGDCGDAIIRRFDAPGDLRMDSVEDVTELRFDGLGALVNTGNQTRNFDICGSGGLGRRVEVSLIGRTRSHAPGSANEPEC